MPRHSFAIALFLALVCATAAATSLRRKPGVPAAASSPAMASGAACCMMPLPGEALLPRPAPTAP